MQITLVYYVFLGAVCCVSAVWGHTSADEVEVRGVLGPVSADSALSSHGGRTVIPRTLMRHEVGPSSRAISSSDVQLNKEVTGSRASMLQQGRRAVSLSRNSAQWNGQIVYAIFTSALPQYHNALLTQLDTWAAKPFAEKRLVAMGGSNYPAEWQIKDSILASNCSDNGLALACKESALIAEAAARGAAWVVLLGEDNWMNASALDAYLKEQDADTPQALGILGCGRNHGYCALVDSSRTSGLCGGGTYALSRAALTRLVADGASSLMEEYTSTKWPNDMTTSCALLNRNVSLQFLPNLHGGREIKDTSLAHYAASSFSLHNIDPPTMKWIHAYTSGTFSEEEVDSRHEAAFYKGCVRSLNGTKLQALHREWEICVNGTAK